MVSQLPVLDEDPPLRADAAANRDRILAAAQRLFAESDPDCVSMDRIAEEAGVGKGTLFRRFGDRASLALAVLDEQTRRFHEELIRGEPPLGPGAPPRERLEAFGHALLDLIERHGDLMREGERAGARLGSGPYRAQRMHVSVLLAALDPRLDLDVLPDLLLAGLSARLVLHLRRARGLPLAQLKAAWSDQVRGLAPAAP